MIDMVLALPIPFHILIVDDGSPDGTAMVAKEKQVENPQRLSLIERSGKLGLGTAYIAGFRWGMERSFDYIFEMDCDFSHNPADLLRMLETLRQDGTSVVVGSRYVKGGNCVNWPADRLILSYGASYYVRLITWMWVKDPTAGFVGYRRKVLETIDLDKIKFIGYAFQIEMKFAATLLGFQIREIPITFTDRIEGSSKMSKSIVREAIWGVLQMRWMSFFHSFRKDDSKQEHLLRAKEENVS
jgi:dolichol-phosphate mannosyltransferase